MGKEEAWYAMETEDGVTYTGGGCFLFCYLCVHMHMFMGVNSSVVDRGQFGGWSSPLTLFKTGSLFTTE